jgi:fumarylacetoacetate (FAA) hydrolase
MKLASRPLSGSPDGELILVTPDLKTGVSAHSIAKNLLAALENWKINQPQLQKLDADLRAGRAANTFSVEPTKLLAALPRTFLFADGSSFIHHIKLVRKARNAPLPETLTTVPLMYQAESARFLSATENVPQLDFDHGTDLEAEVGVITDFVPMGTSAEKALEKIRLILLINDISLRGLIPAELASGFGFFNSKPSKALSAFAVTFDELGSAWKQGRLHLPMHVEINHKFFGKPNAGQMHFHFGELIAHAAKTRDLQPGTLIGSGTVSNEDATLGSCCLVEKRTIEQIETGKPTTPFLKVGDQVRIWMQDDNGNKIFGEINQSVSAAKA